MILLKIVLENFMNFNGKHEFEFEKGLNYIFGEGMTGKSNLVRSVQFAVLGKTDRYSTSQLINLEHKLECEKRDEGYSCKVEVIFEDQGRIYPVRRSLSMNGKGESNQYASVPFEIADRITAENFKYFHIEELNLEEEDDLTSPRATRMKTAIIRSLQRNIGLGLRMVVLDGIMSGCFRDAARDFVHKICRMDMDQVIIMEKYPDSVKLRQLGIKVFDDDDRFSKIIILPKVTAW